MTKAERKRKEELDRRVRRPHLRKSAAAPKSLTLWQEEKVIEEKAEKPFCDRIKVRAAVRRHLVAVPCRIQPPAGGTGRFAGV